MQEKCHKYYKFINISSGTIYLINYIIDSKIKDIYKYNISSSVFEEFEKIVELYLEIQLERNTEK